MENKHILVMCICLLYKESLISKELNSQELVEQTLKNITIPELRSSAGRTREIMLECKRQIKTMINNGPGHKYNSNILKSKLSSIFGSDDTVTLEMLTGMIVEDGTGIDKDAIMEEIASLITELNVFNSKGKIAEIIEKYSAMVRFNSTSVDWDHIAQEITEKLAPYTSMGNCLRKKGVVDIVDFSKKDSILNVLSYAKDIDSGEGLLSLGHQDLINMTGGGLRLGEAILVSAEEGGGKSLITNMLMLDMMAFNVAKLRPNKGIYPCVIRISLENDTIQDIPWMYKFIVENDTGTAIDIKDIDPAHAAEFLSSRFSQNGWSFINIRLDPTTVTLHDVINIINEYIRQGYDPQIIVVDYLSMLMESGAKSSEYRENMRRMCAFTKPLGAIFITPHQATSEAMARLKTDYPGRVVRQMVGNKLYAECKQLGQEPDIEIHAHIEKVEVEEGVIKSYMTLARGKHRGRSRHTPAKYLYACLPFNDIGTLPWDIGKAKTGILKPGADIGNGGSDTTDWAD